MSSSTRIGSLPPNPNVDTEDWPVLKDNHDCVYRRETENNTFHHYSDHEIVVHHRNRFSSSVNDDNEAPACHILTQTFLMHQNAVDRLVEDMTNHDFCGTSLQKAVLPLGFRRPSAPEFIWFSHGLWGLPNDGGRNASNLDCSRRFDSVVQGMQTWMSNNFTTVVWQTLFRINHHERITNEYIQWDRDCQIETARKYGIPVFDLFTYLGPGDVVRQDFHWTYQTIHNIVKTILLKAFGGQKNYFGKRVIMGKGVPFK
jgi:hypothetical protein